MVELGHESRPVVRVILGMWGGTGWRKKGRPSAEGMDREVHLHAFLLLFPAWFCYFLL